MANRPSVAAWSPERALAAASRLREKLVPIDFGAIGISEYNQRYLSDHLSNRDGATLRLYARLLAHALSKVSRGLDEVVLVDFGGGHGLMSLLAKELGVGTVIFVDVYDASCADVQKLGAALGLTPDRVVCGDLDDLIRDVTAAGLLVDTMFSSDVIEHIYDVPGHLRRLPALPMRQFRAVYASTANIENPRYVRWVSKVQRDVELNPRTASWGHKQRDALQAYRSIRADMIRKLSPALPEGDVEWLATATRGLIEADIAHAVTEFKETGDISHRIDHPTNTCDPTTGNWAEHLMDLDWLKATATAAGFSASIAPGRYELNGSVPKRVAQVLLNLLIGALGRRGMLVSPSYTLTLDR